MQCVHICNCLSFFAFTLNFRLQIKDQTNLKLFCWLHFVFASGLPNALCALHSHLPSGHQLIFLPFLVHFQPESSSGYCHISFLPTRMSSCHGDLPNKEGTKTSNKEKTGLLDPFFRFWSTLPEGLGCRWSKSGSWKVLFALSQATDSILPVTLMAISARSLDPNPQLVDFPPLNSVKYVKLKTKTKQSVRECSGFQLRSTWTTICVRCYLCISASQK